MLRHYFNCLTQPFYSQECFNSPYGHTHFPTYAENIAFTTGQPYDTSKSQSESVKMLASVAREAGIWLIAGMCYDYCQRHQSP
jgi:hypothetical protein